MNFVALRQVQRLRLAGGLAAVVAGLPALTGCEDHKVVARVNNTPISQAEYYDRVQRVAAIPGQGQLDAGGWTLIQMVKELLTYQLATKKNAVPSDDTVNRFTDYYLKRYPTNEDNIRAGRMSRDDVVRLLRNSLEEFGIGTEGAKAEAKELDDAYKQNLTQLTIPETWVLKSLPVPDETSGEHILQQLKTTGDFRRAVLEMGGSSVAAAASGKETSVDPAQMPPAMRDALANVPAGQFAPRPIQSAMRDPQTGQTRQIFIVVQVVRKEKSHVPTLDEVRPLVEQIALAKRYPAWNQHKEQELADFTRQSAPGVQIDIARYQPLLQEYILPQAEARTATAPGGTLAPQSAPPGAGPAGATAPRKITPPKQ